MDNNADAAAAAAAECWRCWYVIQSRSFFPRQHTNYQVLPPSEYKESFQCVLPASSAGNCAPRKLASYAGKVDWLRCGFYVRGPELPPETCVVVRSIQLHGI